MSKRELKARIEKFEDEALANLDPLLRTASRVLRSSHDAEDVVQETFLRAWKYFESFDEGTNCRAWLFRIMFNVINAKKGKQAKAPETFLEDMQDGENHQSNVIVFDPLKQIERQEVLEATNRLSDEYRTVLWLVVVEDLSYREAAEVLNVPIGTVMSRLHRARRELRKLLRTEQAGEATN